MQSIFLARCKIHLLQISVEEHPYAKYVYSIAQIRGVVKGKL